MGEWREVSLTSGGFPGCSNYPLIPGATMMVARTMTRARVFTTAAMRITASMVVTTPADLNGLIGWIWMIRNRELWIMRGGIENGWM